MIRTLLISSFVLVGCSTVDPECPMPRDHMGTDRILRHHDQMQYTDHQRLEERLKSIEAKLDEHSRNEPYGRVEGRP